MTVQTSIPSDNGSPAYDRHHVVERLAHGVYGLILLTATLGELRLHEDDAQSAVTFVAAGAVVLVVAHSYSQLVAQSAIVRAVPSQRQLAATLVDQLPLAIPATLAVAVLLLADRDVIALDSAYTITITGSLAALFAIGVTIGVHRHRRALWGIGIGAANLGLGVVIIGAEAAAAH